MQQSLNADFTQAVLIDTAGLPWQASPSPTVWRKRLELYGPAEAGRVTSVVRYDAGSAFPSHPHPEGEEILVLEGVFSDQHGDYPAGTYLLNPEGFAHAPFSREGCVLFVKLRQYPGLDRPQVKIDTTQGDWQAGEAEGVERLPLYEDAHYPERISLLRLAPGAAPAPAVQPRGAEIFVLEGDLTANGRALGTGAWLRLPARGTLALSSAKGALAYFKEANLLTPRLVATTSATPSAATTMPASAVGPSRSSNSRKAITAVVGGTR